LRVSPGSGLVPFTIAAHASVSLDDGAPAIDVYSFDFGDGSVISPQTSADATHTYASAGWFSVTASVSYVAGSSSAVSVAVRIHARPSTTVPDLVGLSKKSAKATARASELNLRMKQKVTMSTFPGYVISQSLVPDKRVPTGKRITFTVAAAANPWGYNWGDSAAHFSLGGPVLIPQMIYDPPSSFCSYYRCIANFPAGTGYVIQCRDGWFSKSGGRSGSCSSHGGNDRTLYGPRPLSFGL